MLLFWVCMTNDNTLIRETSIARNSQHVSTLAAFFFAPSHHSSWSSPSQAPEGCFQWCSHPYPTPTPPIPVPPRDLPPGTAAIQLPSWHAAPQGVAPETPSATVVSSFSPFFAWMIDKSKMEDCTYKNGLLRNVWWTLISVNIDTSPVEMQVSCQTSNGFRLTWRVIWLYPCFKGILGEESLEKIQKFGLWRITANFQSLPPRASAHASGSTKKQKINLRGTFLVNDSTKSGAGLHASRI